MACYDYTQKKIFGCKEGSLTWWHEKGHQWQHELGWSAELNVWSGYLLLSTLAGLVMDYKVIAWWSFVGLVSIILAEEFIAWVYGIKMWRSKSV